MLLRARFLVMRRRCCAWLCARASSTKSRWPLFVLRLRKGSVEVRPAQNVRLFFLLLLSHIQRSCSASRRTHCSDAVLKSPYYRAWSRAQLNNTEYAPMLSLLALLIKVKADAAKRELTWLEKCACIGSVVTSYIFMYAAATQRALDHANLRPGRGGMSPLRPIGAFGRYGCMALLIYCAAA